MAQGKYLLYFNGKIDGRETQAGVKRKLSAAFKLTPHAVECLFIGKPVVIKRGIDYMRAINYLNAFRHCGAICEIQPIVPARQNAGGGPWSVPVETPLPAKAPGKTEHQKRPGPHSRALEKKALSLFEGPSRRTGPVYLAPFFRRLGAFLVDVALLVIFGLALGNLFFHFLAGLGGYGRLVGFCICLLYFGILNSTFGGGRTFGKQLAKIRVVDRSGKPPTLARSIFRTIVMGLPFFLFDLPLPLPLRGSLVHILIQIYTFFSLVTIGYLFLFNRRNRQSLHDVIAGTYVMPDFALKSEYGKPIWRGHMIVTAFFGLLAILFFSAIGPGITHQKEFLEIARIQHALQASGHIRHAKIVSGSILNRFTAHTTHFDFLNIYAVAKTPLRNPELVGNEIVAAILAQNTSLTYLDATPINLVLAYGFDMGLAWGGDTHHTYHTTKEWKRVTLHARRAMSYPAGVVAQFKIPTDFEVPTQSKFNQAMHAFLKRNCVAAYDPDTDGKKVPAQAVIDFLNKACGLIPNGDDNQPVEVARIEESGAALIATGCRSPLVDLYYGRILLWQDRIALAGVHLNRARERLDSDYPAINHFFLLEALAAVTLSQKRPLESQRLSKRSLSYLAKAVITGEFQPDEIPMVYRLIDAGDGQAFENKSFGQFYEYIKKEKTIDPWLPAIIKGRHEIHLAMEIRGTGEASAVPDMDWEGFQRHLIKARMQLTKAWTLKPEYPEASALMIPVTNRGFGNPGETSKLWFYRAVNAQMDYLPAYDMLMTSLRPMWGGSHKKLLTFGEECLATGRYDTWVPFVYLKAIRMVGSELKNCNWRAPFRIPKVNNNLERLFEQALAAPAHQGVRDNILIQRALTKAWCGHWVEARNELIANKSRPDLARGFCGEPLSWNNRGWEDIYAELTAFTGSQQRLLIRAESLQLENQTQKALALFKKVIKTLPGEKEIQRYLWNRIAEIMLEVPSQKIQGPLLHMAAAMDRGDVVQLLLNQGAAIQERDRNGSTALHYAAQHGRTQMVAMLLDHGADIDSGDRLERTPLVVALANGHPEVAKLLLGRNADSMLVTSEGFTPFHYAVRGEDQEVFQLLLSKGADINAANMYQVTPLHMALYEGKSEAARFVIANGGRLDQPDNHQWSPLHLAVVNDMPEIAIQMIEAGADINISMERNWTPLHLAAHYGQEFVVRLLLEKGADLTAQLHDGDTPLEIARKSRNHRIEKLLLEFKPGSI